MSGHSKWHSIKHQKGKADADRGKLFTKLAREIIVAAKAGGPNPDSNITLRAAITRARAISMPQDNIKRAIARGAGGDDTANYEDLTYEGYGPGGVAVLVNCLTDNKQRTVAEVRAAFNRSGGRLAESGSVAYLFTPKGILIVDPGGASEDAVTEAAIEGGAEDVQPTDDGGFEITAAPGDLIGVQKALDDAHIAYASAELTMLPQTMVDIAGKEASQVLRLVDTLEDNDDVQKVYANFDISDAEMEAVEGGR
jgi:YebC/PmpR family DNA-binding regulatory protein